MSPVTTANDPHPPQWEDDQPGANETPQSFHEDGLKAGQGGPNSRRVGWTLRSSTGVVQAGFAFKINAQDITRSHSSRAQLFATKSAFFVDNFGPGPTSISVRFLVASGQDIQTAGGVVSTTNRADVQRFLQTIYYPSLAATSKPLQVYFHDNHFAQGMQERVFFLSDSLDIQRSVDLHGVWMVQFSMTGLDPNPYNDVLPDQSVVSTSSSKVSTARYLVKRGDTLESLARRCAAGSKAKDAVKRMIYAIIELNPTIQRRRHGPTGQTLTPYQLAAGEVLSLPT